MNTATLEKPYKDLYSAEFQKKLAETSTAVVLDVRTAEEFRSGRIPQAINIDVMDSSFIAKITELDSAKTYFVYCRGGSRSGHACSIMTRNGLKAYNLAGGIMNWKGKII
jgi:rhodanese-related sulfurtransferase